MTKTKDGFEAKYRAVESEDMDCACSGPHVGCIRALEPGESVGVCACTGGLASDYRLACLKLAFEHDDGVGNPMGFADQLFDYVTGKLPPQPQFYLIENRDEPKDSDSAEARFMAISGAWIYYAAERYAYRFRSFDEASEALIKFQPELGGDMTIVPLPLGTELF